MNKKLRYYLLLSVAALAPIFAAEAAPAPDPVQVDGIVKFSSIQKTMVPRSGGTTTKAEVTIVGIKNPVEDANKDWIRNVEVELTLVYKDEKTKGKFVVLRAKTMLYAIKLKQKVTIPFFIPWESYEIYRLKDEPYAYAISISVGGSAIELTKDNVASMLSKTILKAADPKASFESFTKLVTESSGVNEGVLVPLNKAPFGIQLYEYGASNSPLPTYIEK